MEFGHVRNLTSLPRRDPTLHKMRTPEVERTLIVSSEDFSRSESDQERPEEPQCDHDQYTRRADLLHFHS